MASHQTEQGKKKKRFRSEVTMDDMTDFLARPPSKLEDLNRSLRKSYQKGFFRDSAFDGFREVSKKLKENEADSVESQAINENDSEFSIHNDLRTVKRRQRQKLRMNNLSNDNEQSEEEQNDGLDEDTKVKAGVKQSQAENKDEPKSDSSSSSSSSSASSQSSQSSSDAETNSNKEDNKEKQVNEEDKEGQANKSENHMKEQEIQDKDNQEGEKSKVGEEQQEAEPEQSKSMKAEQNNQEGDSIELSEEERVAEQPPLKQESKFKPQPEVQEPKLKPKSKSKNKKRDRKAQRKLNNDSKKQPHAPKAEKIIDEKMDNKKSPSERQQLRLQLRQQVKQEARRQTRGQRGEERDALQQQQKKDLSKIPKEYRLLFNNQDEAEKMLKKHHLKQDSSHDLKKQSSKDKREAQEEADHKRTQQKKKAPVKLDISSRARVENGQHQIAVTAKPSKQRSSKTSKQPYLGPPQPKHEQKNDRALPVQKQAKETEIKRSKDKSRRRPPIEKIEPAVINHSKLIGEPARRGMIYRTEAIKRHHNMEFCSKIIVESMLFRSYAVLPQQTDQKRQPQGDAEGGRRRRSGEDEGIVRKRTIVEATGDDELVVKSKRRSKQDGQGLFIMRREADGRFLEVHRDD